MDLARRSDLVLHANPRRVMCRIFIPGEEELIRGRSRAKTVVDRCLELPEEVVMSELDQTLADFEPRHRDLVSEFELHFAAVSGLVDSSVQVSEHRRLLIGAYLTQEYAFEATAYFNPSMVMHPDQSGVSHGSLRFLMSVRAVGEGHISSLVFRSGIIGPDGSVTVDPASRFATTNAQRYSLLNSSRVRQVAELNQLDLEELEFVLGMLPDQFTPQELEVSLTQLHSMRFHKPAEDPFTDVLQNIANSGYRVEFSADTDLSERVLWPAAANERHGIEDARWVRIAGENGSPEYRATYTGFDGSSVTSRLLHTHDFVKFSSHHLTGEGAANKGMALFPRPINGQLTALSRWDRENISLAHSEDGYHWDVGPVVQHASRSWELVHIGNCGSPIELDNGWLVITHGTGPMRRYALSAILLDLDDPSVMKASLNAPLLTTLEEERDGYVPNVVYSCGGLLNEGHLVIPYGFSDCSTGFALVDLEQLLASMEPNTRHH